MKSNIKFIIFALFIVTSLSIVKGKPRGKVITRIIKPVKHYDNLPPWQMYSKDEIINNDIQ